MVDICWTAIDTRLACMVGSIMRLRCVEAVAQLQFDVLPGKRDPLNMALDEFTSVVRN